MDSIERIMVLLFRMGLIQSATKIESSEAEELGRIKPQKKWHVREICHRPQSDDKERMLDRTEAVWSGSIPAPPNRATSLWASGSVVVLRTIRFLKNEAICDFWKMTNHPVR
jgi:hypothetical protein